MRLRVRYIAATIHTAEYCKGSVMNEVVRLVCVRFDGQRLQGYPSKTFLVEERASL